MIFENEKILSNPSLSSLLEGKTGMIAPKQSRQKQRVVIQFLLSEGETAWNISRRLKQVYGDGAIDYSTVTRWVKRINDGREEPAESNLCDGPRSGRPSSTHSSANIDQADVVESKNTKSLTCLEMSKVLLQHDNGRPHTSLKTRQEFHIPHIRQTWHRLTSICFGPPKESSRGDISPVMKRSKLLLGSG